jgi:hypothetical protein
MVRYLGGDTARRLPARLRDYPRNAPPRQPAARPHQGPHQGLSERRCAEACRTAALGGEGRSQRRPQNRPAGAKASRRRAGSPPMRPIPQQRAAFAAIACTAGCCASRSTYLERPTCCSQPAPVVPRPRTVARGFGAARWLRFAPAGERQSLRARDLRFYTVGMRNPGRRARHSGGLPSCSTTACPRTRPCALAMRCARMVTEAA